MASLGVYLGPDQTYTYDIAFFAKTVNILIVGTISVKTLYHRCLVESKIHL